jgi:hypothetical protein
MHEAMARYQYIYGLKPLGPHRALADALLTPLRANCPRCEGRGIVTIAGGEWLACVRCEGTGGMWTVPEAALQAAIATILETFPAAVATEVPADFLSGTAVLDLDNKEMHGAGHRRSRPETSVQVADARKQPAPPNAAQSPPVASPRASNEDRAQFPWLWFAAFVLVRGLIAMAAR